MTEEIFAGDQRHAAQVAAGDDHRVLMNGIGRARAQHDVARTEHRQRQVSDALLGADGDDGLAVGVDVDVEAPLVPIGDRHAQLVDAARHRVAVVGRVLRRLDQLGDHVRRRGAVRVAEAEVDDVLAGPPRLLLQIVDDVEDIRWEPLDSGEVHLPSATFLRRPRGRIFGVAVFSVLLPASNRFAGRGANSPFPRTGHGPGAVRRRGAAGWKPKLAASCRRRSLACAIRRAGGAQAKDLRLQTGPHTGPSKPAPSRSRKHKIVNHRRCGGRGIPRTVARQTVTRQLTPPALAIKEAPPGGRDVHPR